MKPEFDEKINSKLNLIGFDNGVFDLSTMTFRMGAPDDFVTVTTKYSLPVTLIFGVIFLKRRINSKFFQPRTVSDSD